MRLSRRSFLHTGVAVCTCFVGMRSAFSSDASKGDNDEASDSLPSGGCAIAAKDSALLLQSKDSFSLESDDFGSGDQNLDKFLGRSLVRTSHFFDVRPAFGFYEDNNAQASPGESEKIKGTWGTVLFGRPLFDGEIKKNDKSGMTIISVIAHEFGHVLQFKKGLRERILQGQKTVKRLELHADILSGCYIGYLKKSNPGINVYKAGEIFHRIGDYSYNSDHHGTPEERVAASQFGFERGRRGDALSEVVQDGLNYISDK